MASDTAACSVTDADTARSLSSGRSTWRERQKRKRETSGSEKDREREKDAKRVIHLERDRGAKS
jgi:hypothetical protein